MSEVKIVYKVSTGYLKETARLGGGCDDIIWRVCGCELHLRASYYCKEQFV
jgi:hypothetical protein